MYRFSNDVFQSPVIFTDSTYVDDLCQYLSWQWCSIKKMDYSTLSDEFCHHTVESIFSFTWDEYFILFSWETSDIRSNNLWNGHGTVHRGNYYYVCVI